MVVYLKPSGFKYICLEMSIRILHCIFLAGLFSCFSNLVGCTNTGQRSSVERFAVPSFEDTLLNGISLVKVAKGPFKSGLACSTQKIDYDYWIGKFEITNEQYFKFLKEAIEQQIIFTKDNKLFIPHPDAPSSSAHCFLVKYLDHAIYIDTQGKLTLNITYAQHPVTSVSWYGANAFCKYYGFVLPNEKEWEKAARANNSTRFSWGDDINGHYANFLNSHDPYEPGTTPVGYYNGRQHAGFQTKNACSPYGCYDMAGNAWEWTRDLFQSDSKNHLGKGGSFNIHTPAGLQIYYVSTFRVAQDTPPLDCTHLADGFRVVKRFDHE